MTPSERQQQVACQPCRQTQTPRPRMHQPHGNQRWLASPTLACVTLYTSRRTQQPTRVGRAKQGRRPRSRKQATNVLAGECKSRCPQHPQLGSGQPDHYGGSCSTPWQGMHGWGKGKTRANGVDGQQRETTNRRLRPRQPLCPRPQTRAMKRQVKTPCRLQTMRRGAGHGVAPQTPAVQEKPMTWSDEDEGGCWPSDPGGTPSQKAQEGESNTFPF